MQTKEIERSKFVGGSDIAAITMKNGIYYDISWADYRAIDLPSPSLLKHGRRSMRRLQRVINGEHPGPDPKTTAVGNIVHAMVSGEFEQRFAVMPAFENDAENLTATGKASKSKTTKYYKDSVKQWQESIGDKEAVTEVQVNTAKKVVGEIHKCKPAKELIDNSRHEVVVIGEIEGVKCKTRLDGWWESKQDVWDIKTTDDIESTAFYRQYKKLGYGFQFGFHSLLLQSAINWFPRPYQVIAAEVKDDFEVAVIEIPTCEIERQQEWVKQIVTAYRVWRKETGKWVGLYPNNRGYLSIPNWDMSSDEDLDFDGIEDDEAEPAEVHF